MRNKKSGFTLVELLIVIFLLGIVAAIGANSWNRYVQNTNFRTAAREIEADIKQMKEIRISNAAAAVCTITFDVGLNTYTKFATGLINETKSPATLHETNTNIHLASVNGAAGVSTITFTERGLLSPNMGSIVLKNNPDRNSTATITYSATGRTYVTFDMQ